MQKIFLLFFIVLLISSCVSNNQTTTEGAINKYFDIDSFFRNEIIRLTKTNTKADKQVFHNNQSQERKSIKINWETELQVFVSSAINKPSWRDSYTIQVSNNQLIYTAKDSSLKTKRIEIDWVADEAVKRIVIQNRVTNRLYHTNEILEYFPDSLYSISKFQHVIILGDNRYHISGKMVK